MAWQGRATAPRPPPPRLARSTRCPPHHTIALLPRRRAPVASPPCRRVPAALHSPVASPHSFSCCAPGRTRPSQRCDRVPVIPSPLSFVAPSPVFLPRLERRSQKMFHVKHLFSCRMTLQQVFHVKHPCSSFDSLQPAIRLAHNSPSARPQRLQPPARLALNASQSAPGSLGVPLAGFFDGTKCFPVLFR